MYSDRILARMTVFPCILYQRLQVRLDGHVCAVLAVGDMLRSVCLTYLGLCYAGEDTVSLPSTARGGGASLTACSARRAAAGSATLHAAVGARVRGCES